MDITFSEEQQMVKDAARQFFQHECPQPVIRELEEDPTGFRPDLWRKMAKLGWLGLLLPESSGGQGGSFANMALIVEEHGYAGLNSPLLATVGLGGLIVSQAGNEAQKGQLLPRLCSGDLLLSVALVEEGGRLGPKEISTKAISTKGGFRITGRKLFVPYAHIADYLVCVAKTGDEGISLFLIERKQPGVKINLLDTAACDRQCEVVLNGVEVPPENRLGELNRGWEYLSKVLDQATVLQCAEMVGGAQAAFDIALQYSRQRVQFDRPIAAFQVVQHHMVDMYRDIQVSRYLTHEAAWRLDEGLPCALHVSMAKAKVNTAYPFVTRMAHRIYGGVGYYKEADLEGYTRRALGAQAILGDTDYHLERVAQELSVSPGFHINA